MKNINIVLQLEGICKYFGGIKALNGVDFQLQLGEVHALLGENGAGKSTLIKIITGVHKPSSGAIYLNGTKDSIDGPIDARKKGIAAIYQELSLITSLTVAENIFLGNEPSITFLGFSDRKKLYQNSDEYLRKFGIDIDSKEKIENLGMGQKRIVEIVKALATNADILLLDEPTTGMSKVEIDTLFEIIALLKKKNVTMIYISHYLEEVFRVCDRATVFKDGSNVKTFKIGEVTTNELVTAMIGKEIKVQRIKAIEDHKLEETVLELEEFQTTVMTEPISLKLKKSEILGITGIIGAGKSELALSIFGRYKKTCGKMKLYGDYVEFKQPYDTKKYHVAFIPEDRKSQGLFLDDSVSDNVVLPSIEKTQTKIGLLSKIKKHKIAKTICHKLQLTPLDTTLQAKTFSGGNQQKIIISKWLSISPNIVLMDEPTRGIDVGAKESVYKLIAEFSEEDKSVIIFSSEFEELIGICDRILVLYKGKIVGEIIPHSACSENILSLALGGNCEFK